MPKDGTALITLDVGEPTAAPPAGDVETLLRLQRHTFRYFEREWSPHNGLVADRTEPGAPASIAAVGLALSTYAVAAERGLLSRAEATAMTLTTLRFFHASRQGPEPDATGYKGFYYHFLDMGTGRRAYESELSTIDTALFIAGALSAGLYFDGPGADEQEIRQLADDLYRRVDWAWARNGAETLSHGWTPETGFLTPRWSDGYSEAMILYILALGSPTFPIGEEGYRAWSRTFKTVTAYDLEYIYAGPLFIHQLSHVWIDFRGIRDARNREVGFDYFENSRRATLVHQRYAIANPLGFEGYSEFSWGITASDGPGPATRVIKGHPREFHGYLARGAPFGPDDGTLSPWAVVASLPFAPEEISRTLRHAIERLAKRRKLGGGFDASYNRTFPSPDGGARGWVAPFKIGLNEGPIILMIENYLSGLVWSLFRRSPAVVTGLRRAGFEGGWLDAASRVEPPAR
jgi:hypothetical protein